jgi:prephenate dehydrogenase
MKILENAYYIITPCNCEASRKKALELEKLVSSMHAIPLMLDAGKHDEAVSAISHVPHLIAASLVELVRENDDENETMRLLAAGGFKDITRIAQSSPKMWHDICVSNASAITETLSKYISMLIQIRDNIQKGNAGYITELFENSGSYRSSIPNSKGILNRYYEIYLDIADETGAIATIAALLAQNSISIKNIGIIHNREFENGVLRIELYDEKDKVKSMSVLREKSYRIYDR